MAFAENGPTGTRTPPRPLTLQPPATPDKRRPSQAAPLKSPHAPPAGRLGLRWTETVCTEPTCAPFLSAAVPFQPPPLIGEEGAFVEAFWGEDRRGRRGSAAFNVPSTIGSIHSHSVRRNVCSSVLFGEVARAGVSEMEGQAFQPDPDSRGGCGEGILAAPGGAPGGGKAARQGASTTGR